MARHAGISLPELLMALAIGALVTTLAIPSFGSLALDGAMTGEVNRFVHTLHRALAESEQRGRDVAVCPSSGGRQCSPAAPWHQGWILFVNGDRDDPPVVDPGEPILEVVGPWSTGTITANRQAFAFRPFGRRSVNGTLVFCDRRGVDAARTVVVSPTGRPRSTPPVSHNKSLTCPA